MKTFLISIALTAALVFISSLFHVQFFVETGIRRKCRSDHRHPWTPLSFAGVARRSMYREAASGKYAALAWIITRPLRMPPTRTLLPRKMLLPAQAAAQAECSPSCDRGCRSKAPGSRCSPLAPVVRTLPSRLQLDR